MKEIDLGDGVTVIEYENDKIYENARMIKYLCILSFVMAVITASIYIIIHTMRNTWTLDIMFYYLFFIYLIFPPFALALQYWNADTKPCEYSESQLNSIRRRFKSNKKKITHFPFASTICGFLSFEFMKASMLFVVGLFDASNYAAYIGIWANHIGQMGLSTIVIYIALIYLIKNCILMNKEWEANPPLVV